MSTAELKIDVISRITTLQEIRIIEEIQKLLDFEMDQGVFQLTENQKKRILEAKNDLVLTEEKANNDIEKWLQER
jgi:vacuolar-type H+-ATPase subunit H